MGQWESTEADYRWTVGLLVEIFLHSFRKKRVFKIRFLFFREKNHFVGVIT